MKILQVHNFYQQAGGEDQVVAAERKLLEEHGHRVAFWSRHNDDIGRMSPYRLALSTVWNQQAYRECRELIRQERPDVMHVHNTFPLFSPAIYYAARAEGVAVVQTLHNYRLLCLNAFLHRDGKVCEDCLGCFPWQGIQHACYRQSRAASLISAALLGVHRSFKTWQRAVDAFIVLTDFQRQKMVAGGLPAEKVHVKQNFVTPDPLAGGHDGNFVLFCGRLSPEKGVRTLLNAWRCNPELPPLVLAGTGGMEAEVKAAASSDARLQPLGRLARNALVALMKRARLLVFPSECFETFGMSVIEAYATGLPVVASRLGAMAELVQEGATGLLFNPGDSASLAQQVLQGLSHPDQLVKMGAVARQKYLVNYTATKNMEILSGIYQTARAACPSRRVAKSPLES